MKFRLLPIIAATLAALLLASGHALAEKRIALVIGNGTYPKVGNLANPPNDARLMASTLRQVGFDVIESIDVDQKAMKRAISNFGKKLSDAGKDAVGLFYYAGHGVQVNGINYLIPVNVSIDSEADVDIEAVAADGVQAQMAYAGNRLNIIVMDACRNNPFKRGFRSAARGLARMSATRGTLIAYATAPGDVAADGTGTNSPYTEALSKAILTPGLTVERMFKQVRNDVVAATNEKQTPWESSSLTGGDFYFKGGKVSSPQAKTNAPSPSAAPQVDKEIVFWETIKDSTDASMFEAYLEQYPKGSFAALARAKIKKYGKQQVAVVMPPNQPAPVPQSKTKAQPDGGVLPARPPAGVRAKTIFMALLMEEVFRRHFNLARKNGNKQAIKYVTPDNYAREHPEMAKDLGTYNLKMDGGALTFGPEGRRIVYRRQKKKVQVILPPDHETAKNRIAIYARAVNKISDAVLKDIKPLEPGGSLKMAEIVKRVEAGF